MLYGKSVLIVLIVLLFSFTAMAVTELDLDGNSALDASRGFLNYADMESYIGAQTLESLPTPDDQIMILNDPAGTPDTKKIALQTLINFAGKMFEGNTVTALTVGDTTPEVVSGGLYDTTGATTVLIEDFVDSGGDHSEFEDGDFFGVIMNDSNATIDFSTNSNIEGNANVDFTGDSSQMILLVFVYEDVGTWYCINLHIGLSNPASFGVAGIELPTLEEDEWDDQVTTRTLVASELKNKIISNGGLTATTDFELPVQAEGWNFMLLCEAAYNMTLDPNGTETLYLNGTVMAAGEKIVNEACSVGESLSCYSTERDIFCESKYTDWKEDTP